MNGFTLYFVVFAVVDNILRGHSYVVVVHDVYIFGKNLIKNEYYECLFIR